MKKIIFLIFIVLSITLTADDVRPVRDDIGFCWRAEQVNRLMDFLEKQETAKTEPGRWVAGISPHDDYLYAGRVFYPLFRGIKTKEVVIFGVTHSTVRKKLGNPERKVIFDEHALWTGPFKKVEISPLREYLKKKLSKEHYLVSNEAHRMEHSIESMIPFLQYFNRDVKITPIMVTGMDFEAMDELSGVLAGCIAAYITANKLEIGKDIFFLVSADANHYGKAFDNTVFGLDEAAHQKGTDYDKQIAATCLTGPMDKKKMKDLTSRLWGKTHNEYGDTLWCGKFSIPFGMLTTMKTVGKITNGKALKGRVLRYSDTYTEGVLPIKKPGYGITAPFSLKHWVGFVSVGFSL